MNSLSEIWYGIQDYFDDWLKKNPGGRGAYATVIVDLSEAHDEKEYNNRGNQIIIVKSDSTAHIKLNDCRNGNINTTKLGLISTPFKKFFVTNEAKTGKLELLIGSKGVFGAVSSRIQAVLTDPEDAWGNIHNIGGAELAARLGSINTFDRRGNVIKLEDFEGGTLFWNTMTGGAGAGAALDTTWGKSGSQSCKLTAGAGAAGYAGIYNYFGSSVTGKIGLEISFTLDAATTLFTLNFIYHDGAHKYPAYIEYDHANGKFILDDGGSLVDILTDFTLLSGSTKSFHTWKLVIDTDTKKYVRMMIDDTVVDLSSYKPKEWVDATKSSIYVYMRHSSTDAAAKSIWIDNCILTQNEP